MHDAPAVFQKEPCAAEATLKKVPTFSDVKRLLI
jgi:hypothetical protein